MSVPSGRYSRRRGWLPLCSLLVASLLAAAAGGCGSPVGQLRFHNVPPVWRVNDRQPIPRPAEREFVHMLHLTDAYLSVRLPRAMAFSGSRRALGVNALDEAPDSTWFTNRIGRFSMTVDEVRRGPNVAGNPEQHRPWTILSTKVGGASVGFIIADSRGVRYLLKFDERAVPEMETGADVIVARLLWAAGYNVPEDAIVNFRRGDLILASDAKVTPRHGDKRPMTPKDLRDALALVEIGADGRIRGLVSPFVPGTPIGGYPYLGRRADDPNDLIAHEMRRDVRGQFALFSWLQHTDLREDNTLDAWVEDPADPKTRYVVHYLIDFGKALGTQGYIARRPMVGHTHITDFKYAFLTLPTFGLWSRPWEGRSRPDIVGVGLIDAKTYSPGTFVTNLPYFPFYEADRFDGFWGAKILARFSAAQIRAVVEQARFTDPRATDYLTQVLIARQRMAARYWFDQVNPLDRFEVRDTHGDGDGRVALCFDDLAIVHGLEPVAASSRYDAVAYNYDGQPTGWRARGKAAGARGRSCVLGLSLPRSRARRGGDGYTIVSLVTTRGGTAATLPPVLVHLARDPRTHKARVIGLRRR